jgi:hypothetical protein
MGAANNLGMTLKTLPPRYVLHEVPAYNRRRLCELSVFFVDNFALNGTKEKFGSLTLSLAKENSDGFHKLHGAATFISQHKKPVEPITIIRPEKAISLLDVKFIHPAFFLAVLKALENPALTANEALVQALVEFQTTIYNSAHDSRKTFASAASLAMLEHPKCVVEWLTAQNAANLAFIAGNLWTGTDFVGGSFEALAKKLRGHNFSPQQLGGIVTGTADSRNALRALE